jgi:ubiquinone/menaquinone biosynthesis C-methylase UbiE
MADDIFSNIDGLPKENIKMLADRLEARSEIASFAGMRDSYFDLMDLPNEARILELGAGTGIIGRSYAKRTGFNGTYVVSDLSQALIEYGKEKAASEQLDDKMDFKIINAITGDGVAGEQYDAVIMHTLLSHVPDPLAVLKTAANATRAGGIIAVFDADYQGLLIVSGNDELDSEVSEAFQNNAVAQPTVMRRLPRMASSLNLEPMAFEPTLLADAGKSEFFIGLARAVVGVVAAQGGLDQQVAQKWLSALDDAIKNKSFFAACSYFTYLYRKT